MGLRDWQRTLPGALLLGIGQHLLVWAAYHACVMLEGDLSRFHFLVKLMVPVGGILCFFF